MGLIQGVTVSPLSSVKGGMTEFYTPQSSHETIMVQIPAGTIDDLFVHRTHTDQLLVVRGCVVLVTPGVLHGAINPSAEPCVVINAVFRHKPAHELDYRPLKLPFPYDMSVVQSLWTDLCQQAS
jgi:oxalate decarboxylase/phosphoglucose isomerase-like protein (cupin superfamily)